MAGRESEPEPASLRWSLQSGASVENLMEEVTRRNLFRKEVIKKVTDGACTQAWPL